MRTHIVLAGFLVLGLAFLLVRPALGLIRFSARLAVWLVLIGIVLAATVLSTQHQNGLSPDAATYQSQESAPSYR